MHIPSNVTVNVNVFACGHDPPPCPPDPPVEKGKVIFEIGPTLDQAIDVIPIAMKVKPDNDPQSPVLGEPDVLVKLTDIQWTTVRPKNFKDARGNVIPVDDTVVFEWMTDNSDVLNLTPADDAKSCRVATVGPIGSAQLTMKATWPDGKSIAGLCQFDVGTSAPASVELEVDPPTDLDLVQKKARAASRGH